MKKLLVLGVLMLGISGLGLGQNNNNQDQDNNNQGQNSGGKVAMPEGTVVELPLVIGGLGFWFWWRHRSRSNLGAKTRVQ